MVLCCVCAYICFVSRIRVVCWRSCDCLTVTLVSCVLAENDCTAHAALLFGRAPLQTQHSLPQLPKRSPWRHQRKPLVERGVKLSALCALAVSHCARLHRPQQQPCADTLRGRRALKRFTLANAHTRRWARTQARTRGRAPPPHRLSFFRPALLRAHTQMQTALTGCTRVSDSSAFNAQQHHIGQASQCVCNKTRRETNSSQISA